MSAMCAAYALGMAAFVALGVEFTWTPPEGEYSYMLDDKPEAKLSFYPFVALLAGGSLWVSGVWLWRFVFDAERSAMRAAGLTKHKHLREALNSPTGLASILGVLVVRGLAALSVLVSVCALLLSFSSYYLGYETGPSVEYGTWGSVTWTTTYFSNLKILWFEVLNSVPILEFSDTFKVSPPARPDALGVNLLLLAFRVTVVLLFFSTVVQTSSMIRSHKRPAT